MKWISRPELAAVCCDRQRSSTMGSATSHQLTRMGKSMAIVPVGIDLAKNVLALHGVSAAGHVELRRPASSCIR